MSAVSPATPLVRMTGITREYRSGDIVVRALRGVSVEVRAGEMVAIMGPSGSGKSTLMNLLGCLDRPTAGNYLLDGVDVAGLGERQLAAVRSAKIGFVFQSFNLLARTPALGNVELPLVYQGVPARERRRRATEALTRVGLSHRLKHVPSTLSGGEQQRVSIARALVTRPPILLADEPTGNLDSRTSLEIMALLQELNERDGVLVLLVTHERDIAEHCTRAITIRDGQVQSDVPIAGHRSAARALAQATGTAQA